MPRPALPPWPMYSAADDEGALDQLVALSHRIAASYAGFNASVAALGHIVGQGALWTLGGAPGRLPFLQVRCGPLQAASCMLGAWPKLQLCTCTEPTSF